MKFLLRDAACTRMLLMLILGLCGPTAAFADEPAPTPAPSTPVPASGVSIDAGAAGIIVPRFPGSGKERFRALPDIAVTVGDRFFASFAGGIGAHLYDRHGLDFGVLARPDLGRRASDTAHDLPGLHKVDFAPELGGFAQVRLTGPLSLRAEVRKAVGGYDGVVADLALSWAKPVSKRLSLVVSPNLRIADARFMRAYFGVTPRRGGIRRSGGVSARRRVGTRRASRGRGAPAWPTDQPQCLSGLRPVAWRCRPFTNRAGSDRISRPAGGIRQSALPFSVTAHTAPLQQSVASPPASADWPDAFHLHSYFLIK